MRASRIAALAVILLAGVLSAAWAFLVPIFQAPDEPAHFDYAISIYDAGRLIRLADGKPDWIVSPYTRYLMRASDFDRIVGKSSMRALPGYGSSAFFARLNAGAPRGTMAQSTPGRISYIAPLYPFGFYGLEALWMRAVSFFSTSLTTLFFAARLLCVLLMMLALYFNYRTALNLGIPRWTSVALVAAVGFFPLTSFVSSYVQPDNLAYALVSAALFFATELRADRVRLSTVAALGITLGFLAVTKYQFFLSVAIPVVPFVALRVLQCERHKLARIYRALALALPIALLLGIQKWIVDRSAPTGAAGPTTITLQPFHSALADGAVATLHYVTATTLAAVINFFLWGGCAATFWQVVGWVDTPIVIVNPNAESWIRAGIGLITIVVALAVAFALGRNLVRVANVCLRGRVLAAVRSVIGDAVLNSYLCFFAIMLALYVLSDNAYGAEGRQWYPFVFVGFLCLVWYAPRALRRRHQAATAVLTGVLLAYSLVAATYALADIRTRYYGPQTDRYVAVDPPASEIAPRTFGRLWPLADAAYHVSDGTVRFSYPRGSRLAIVGVAISPDFDVQPTAVSVMLDGRTTLPVLTNQYAFLIAEATHNVADGYRAFYANVETAGMPEGVHTVAAYALLPGRSRFSVIPPIRLFFITQPDGRFSTQTLRRLERGPRVDGTMTLAGACRSGLVRIDGRLANAAAARYSAVWLRAANRPFPARYDPKSGYFGATIPATLLSSGPARAVAYAISAESGAAIRLSQSVTLHAGPPVRCADPLAQLVGV